MIPGFSYDTHSTKAANGTAGANIAYCVAGSGPALLLLHGFPQTHMMWAEIAPKLATHLTVICADLRGHGATSKPYGTEQYSFRCMASDQLSLMSSLGFEQFHIAGHDGGGQVAHRLALDAPLRAISLTMMDIVPTHYLLDRLQQNVEESYYQWVFGSTRTIS